MTISILPTFVITVTDQDGKAYSKTGIPLAGVLGSTITLDMSDLPPGTYTMNVSASGNTGLAFTATVSISQEITHYDQIESIITSPVTGNMLGDDSYNANYAKFSIDTGNGNFFEVGHNGVTIEGEYGILFVERDGNYTYTANDGVIGRQEAFDYKLSVFGQDYVSSLTVTIDVITTGDAGRNTLVSGELDDTFFGGAGADVLIYQLLDVADAAGGNGHDTWTDFNIAEGDQIKVSELLSEGTSINDAITLGEDTDGNVVLMIDRDGTSNNVYGAQAFLTLEGITKTDTLLEELINQGHLF